MPADAHRVIGKVSPEVLFKQVTLRVENGIEALLVAHGAEQALQRDARTASDAHKLGAFVLEMQGRAMKRFEGALQYVKFTYCMPDKGSQNTVLYCEPIPQLREHSFQLAVVLK